MTCSIPHSFRHPFWISEQRISLIRVLISYPGISQVIYSTWIITVIFLSFCRFIPGTYFIIFLCWCLEFDLCFAGHFFDDFVGSVLRIRTADLITFFAFGLIPGKYCCIFICNAVCWKIRSQRLYNNLEFTVISWQV